MKYALIAVAVSIIASADFVSGVTVISNAWLNPTGTSNTANYCVCGQSAKLSIQIAVPPAKLVQCKWKLVGLFTNAKGAVKSFSILAGTFKQKNVSFASVLDFNADLSTKLNKVLSKNGVQKKFINGTLEARLLINATANLIGGGKEMVALTKEVTIMLTQTGHGLSGHIRGDIQQGVTINLGGGTTASTTTDANGYYTFGNLVNGNYIIAPINSYYLFSPTSRNIIVADADQTNINFTAIAMPTYKISGQVGGYTRQGVTINVNGTSTASTITDTNGNYILGSLYNGSYTVTPSKSGYAFAPTSIDVTISDADQTGNDFTATDISIYCIIDVSGGPDDSYYPVSYQATLPPLDDTHKTSRIVLRKIPAGNFVMGSPADELGRDSDETQHNVTLTKDFYMGIYEITQAQFSNVMGGINVAILIGTYMPKHPVALLLASTARGGVWPDGAPDGNSFMGKLQSKTGLPFDLPTEAQWEYACRAGTAKALNNNTDLISTSQDPNVGILGRYYFNGGYSSGTAEVGSYLPNAWGLYDMHGNVSEWCVDWYANYTGDTTDPKGPESGPAHVGRGGTIRNYANSCRSAGRGGLLPGYSSGGDGFRLSFTTGQ